MRVTRGWKGSPESAAGSPSLEALVPPEAALGRRLHLTPLEPGLRQGVSGGPCPPHLSWNSLSVQERCPESRRGDPSGRYPPSDRFQRVKSELRWTNLQRENSQSVINLYRNGLLPLGSLGLIPYFKSSLSFHLGTREYHCS